LKPAGAEEAAELLRTLGEEGRPVRPRGGGTKDWGPPLMDAAVVETGGLNRVLEHNVGDFTAVLEAGVPLAEAQAEFGEHGQMLAIDPVLGASAGEVGRGEASAGGEAPGRDRKAAGRGSATVGGVMAANDSGPLRHRYGGMRDLVVGTTVALSDGTLARSGGKVIKNVAGYDLGKLFCGSFGTLGLIVRVAVRLHPLLPATATATGMSGDPDRLGAAARALAAQPLEADCLDLDWRDGAGRLLVRFGSSASHDQAAATVTRMRELGLANCGVVEDDDELWMTQRVHQRGDCVLKVSGRATDLPAVCRTGAAVVGRPALGLYWLSLPADAAAVAAAREALAPRACTLLDAPPELRAQAWAAPDPGTLAVMARVKERFDPARIFRPGTFVGGI
jgi:glycolate oxidase FAD binding subunit